MNKRIFLYGHAGSQNHGCEAIVRSTTALFSQDLFTLFSHSDSQDRAYQVDGICKLINKTDVEIKRFSLKFLQAYLVLKLKNNHQLLNEYFAINALALARDHDVAFSIGGDNYCYSGAERHVAYHDTVKKQHVKTVLWGCSVEPDVISVMREDLSRYDLITARETITYDVLRKINSNVVLAPDPAFTLEKRPGKYPMDMGQKPYIGINASPLVQGLEQGGNITIENYRTLVGHILESTDRDVALIPHVVWEHNDDRVPLGQLYEEFKGTGRIFMVEDQNCMQLKDIISRCEFFVGARTHATIAAYSTCVPTLVVGYSVKARGIARDLFGSEEGYVLPVQQLRKPSQLSDAFRALYERKDEIRKHLTDMMPEYIAGIAVAKEAVERL